MKKSKKAAKRRAKVVKKAVKAIGLATAALAAGALGGGMREDVVALVRGAVARARRKVSELERKRDYSDGIVSRHPMDEVRS